MSGQPFGPLSRFAGWPWRSLLAVLFLALLPLPIFLPALVFGKMLYGFDVIALGVPLHSEMARCLAAHEWPLWMPDILAGIPGIGGCNLQFAYPTDFLGSLAGLSLQAQCGLDAAFHVALAGLGMFLFLRELGRGVGASLLGAACFAVSGSEVSQVFGGFYNFVEGVALLPWAFWAAHRAWRGQSNFYWGVCGLVLALQILASAAQLFVYTLAALALFIWLPAGRSGPRPIRAASWSGILPGLALALGLAFLISAPQLWPTLQFLHWTARQALSQEQAVSGSIRLSEALTWLVPGYFGWHWPSYHGAMKDCFTSEYFGLLPWALAAAALAAQGRREPMVRWMAGLALAALFLSQREWTPFLALFRHLPVLSGFRIWSRALFLLTFAVCTLCAYGWDSLADAKLRRKALAGAAGFFVVALAAAGLAWALSEASLSGNGGGDSALETLALLPLLAALLWLRFRGLAGGLLLALALGLQLHDQSHMIARFIRFTDPQDCVGTPHAVVPLPPQEGLEPWRIFDHDDSYPNNSILLGYENLSGGVSLPMAGTERIMQAMNGRWQDLISLFNVRYVFAHSQGGSYAQGDKVMITENRRAFPRAWLLQRVRVVGSDEEAYRLLADPGFDPRLEAAFASDPLLGAGKAAGGVDSVEWVARTPLSCRLDVRCAKNSILMLSNAWYPSWRCAIDGAESPVLKADGGLQAVALRAGRHGVEFHFDAGLFQAALAAALAGLLVLAGIGLFELRRSRRP